MAECGSSRANTSHMNSTLTSCQLRHAPWLKRDSALKTEIMIKDF